MGGGGGLRRGTRSPDGQEAFGFVAVVYVAVSAHSPSRSHKPMAYSGGLPSLAANAESVRASTAYGGSPIRASSS